MASPREYVKYTHKATAIPKSRMEYLKKENDLLQSEIIDLIKHSKADIAPDVGNSDQQSKNESSQLSSVRFSSNQPRGTTVTFGEPRNFESSGQKARIMPLNLGQDIPLQKTLQGQFRPVRQLPEPVQDRVSSIRYQSPVQERASVIQFEQESSNKREGIFISEIKSLQLSNQRKERAMEGLENKNMALMRRNVKLEEEIGMLRDLMQATFDKSREVKAENSRLISLVRQMKCLLPSNNNQ